MKRIRYFIVLLLASILFAGEVCAKEKIVRVLAIGNSFSEDAVCQNLYELATAEGQKCVIANMYIGGCSLERHLNNARGNLKAYRYQKIGLDGLRIQADSMMLSKALKDESWDYISLQQVSGLSGIYDSYTPYLPELIRYIKSFISPKTKLIWHQTWAYAQNSTHKDFQRYDCNQMKMYGNIMDASKKVMKEYGFSLIIPSGTAVQNARTTFIGDNMNRDGYHLNLIYGRYTAACTWFETLFGKSVVGNTYAPKNMHPALLKATQEAAHQAVLHPFEVTDLKALTPGDKLYTDSSLPLDIRVEDLLRRMTIEEKVLQLNQYTLGTNNIENNKGVEVKNTPAEIGSLIYFGTEPDLRNRMQRHAMENSRLGIPILFGYDAIHGFRTIFPIPLAQACSWNPGLVEQGCRITAQETKLSGIDWTFSPMIDVSRDPRWGRVAEGYGEDPYTNGVFGQAAVRGYQGKRLDDSLSIAACLKHYVGYGASEAGRDYVYTEISRQTLWDTYLPPYEMSLRSGAVSLMSSFNNISGIPSSANHYTLTEILRNKWGFRGLMVSDWGAVMQLINQKMARDLKEAGKLAINAGVDMDMMSHSYDKYLKELVEEKAVEPAVLDESVRRLLRLKFQLGLFENPYTPQTDPSTRFRRPASVKAAEEMSSQSMVLLKNDGTLPLRAVKRLAVIGPMANNTHDLLGCWWGHGEDKDIHKLLDGITAEFKASEVRYAKGCDFSGEDEAGFEEALQTTKWADIVVMCLGEKGSWSGENNSHADIMLPPIQQRLMQKIHATGKKVILVLANGRPLVLGSAVEQSNAILEMWQPGTDGASAVAGILSGRINPSGKLAMTFPYSQGQIPIYYNRRSSARPTQGFYKDMVSEPLYPFGYGLSYTRYSYGELSASKTVLHKGEKVSVSVPVANDGDMDGMETVFLYVSCPYSRITRPVKELKRFEKRMIRKGETVRFEFVLDVNKDLGFVDEQGNQFVDAGEVNICIGDKTLKLHIE